MKLLLAALMAVFAFQAHARDLGQWVNADPALSAWFSGLRQPDNPSIPCCGEADAYWADRIEVEGGKVIAIITDDRPDEPLRRMHVPVGTRIEIPAHKYKFDRGNPTGHTIVSLSASLDVYCFIQGSGT